ncbi:FAD:protein FMN transferase [Anaerotruncus rubiinfantis]|uniref:FAD:protein FMN transferase n=1 Tax=Anaerotruncus rubiinfantis TaxID=1720200 RepID=UPI0018981E36|nr:FAD:protein FMN transferase [Anaerotruncus rubiinfantis]
MAQKRTFVILAAALLLLLAATGVWNGYRVRRDTPVVGTSFLMDTFVEYKLYGEKAQEAKDAIEAALRGIEDTMSMYIKDSEISRLNENAGKEPVAVSEDTYALLARCKGFGELSGGLFDVTVAPLAAEWGITGLHPKVPAAGKIEELLKLVGYSEIQLGADGKGGYTAMLSREGQAVDVGGVAKGYACDVARRVAQDYGITSGYISIGGNLMVIGEKPDGEPFRFGVRDPRGPENQFLAVVSLPDSTMATSGDYERFFEQDGVRYHHILDPRIGYPAESDLMSVSVVSPDGAYADFMSTYLFISGRDFVLENLDTLECGIIAVDRDKNIYVSESLRAQFQPADSTGGYRFEVAS